MIKKLKKPIQAVLGNKIVRTSLVSINKANTKVFSSTYLLSVPYHWFGFFNFMREQRAVLCGKYHYYRNLSLKRANRVELRRNIHRLEKGLTMQPMRKVFAQNYIIETVESYKEAIKQHEADPTSLDQSELEWAHTVLADFFNATESVGNSKKAQVLFEPLSNFQPGENDKKPFERKNNIGLPTYEQLLNLSLYRRSVRWFEQKPVERECIDNALRVARQSPTACNRLPYVFKIFDDPALVKKVANIPFGTEGYADNIPVIVVLIGKLDSFFSARDRHAIYIDSSLAAMGFTYALEAQGLASCMINWPDFEPLEHKMQKMLDLEYSDRVIMLIAIGYPDKKAKVPYSQKKSLDTIRTYNFEGGKTLRT